jgi:3',5'-nucleoside bisphosphate phosphatase
MFIDLHTHSTASDGTLSPTELVLAAKTAGLDAVALTDHDTTFGLAEALAAGQETGVEVIPGCELSVTWERGEIHLLGLWLPEQPKRLTQTMDELIRYRHDRNHIIIDKLNALGMKITYEEVKALAGDGSVGRPHISQALQRGGYVSSMQEAFDRYLGSMGTAFAPKKILTPEQGVTLLKEEGATVILAHPHLLGLDDTALEKLVRGLMEFGLDGLEAYYSEHTPQVTRNYLAMAERLGLGVSGGSDFHGTVKPEILIGRGRGKLRIPYSVVEGLKARRQRQGLPV